MYFLEKNLYFSEMFLPSIIGTRRTRFTALVGCLLYCCWYTSFGQDPFREYGMVKFGSTVEVPFHTAKPIYQEYDGSLVLETNLGLRVYDGYDFREKDGPSGLMIFEDSEGARWYRNDLYSVTRAKTGAIQKILLKPRLDLTLTAVSESEQRFYLLANDGFLIYNKALDSLEYDLTVPLSGTDQIDIWENGDTVFIKTLYNCKYVLRSEAYQNEYIYLIQNLSNFKNDLMYLPNGDVLSRRNHEVVRLSKTHPQTSALLSFDDNRIISHLRRASGELWLSLRGPAESELYKLTLNGELIAISLDVDRSSYINSIYEDREKNVWISTSGQGVVVLYEQTVEVLDKSRGLGSDNVWSILQADDGDIYFSRACNGMFRSGQVSDVVKEVGCQFSIFQDSYGDFWIAEFLSQTADFQEWNVYGKESGLYSRTIRSIYEDSYRNLWVGTRKVLHLRKGNRFLQYKVDQVDEFDRLFNIVELGNMDLLVAFTSGAVFRFRDQEFTRQAEIASIQSLFKDSEGNIWAGTDSLGLWRWQDESFAPVELATLPRSISLLQEDQLGRLLGICDGNRIFYANKEGLLNEDVKVSFLGMDDGLPLIATNWDLQPTSVLLEDGRIIFPNVFGSICIYPERLGQTPAISSLSFFDDKLDLAIKHQEYHLEAGRNNLVISVRAIRLRPDMSTSMKYFYKDTWIESEDGKMELFNLKPGENRVSVTVRSEQDQSEINRELLVVLAPLWHQQLWVRALAALIGLVLIWLFYRWRVSAIRAQNTRLSSMVDDKTEELEIEKVNLSKALDEQGQLMKKLSESQELKNKMYAHIAHEFRTPLQSIQLDLKADRSTAKEGQVRENIARLLQVSNDLLDLSKAERGQLKANISCLNLSYIIRAEVKRLSGKSRAKNLTWRFDVADECLAYFDPILMSTVVGNLLSNAINFSREGAEVKVSLERTADDWIVSFKDQGIGIPEEELDQLTSDFFQASNNDLGGTGLGLSLVAKILALHDSQLSVTSRLNKGSNFSFRLRASEKSYLQLKSEFQRSEIEKELNRPRSPDLPRVMLVDDDQDFLSSMRSALSSSFSLFAARSALMAELLLESMDAPLDLIVTDYNMPFKNGIEFLDGLQGSKLYESTAVLFLTANTAEEAAISAIRSGADLVLSKPITAERLIHQITQTLSRRKLTEQKAINEITEELIPPNIHSSDRELMEQLESTVSMQFTNPKLSSEDIANEMGLGEKTLRNRVKSISGKTVKEYLRVYRLLYARRLMSKEAVTLAEVAHATGFSSASYFSKAYKAHFGESPRQSSARHVS